jgi:hypothetical protein
MNRFYKFLILRLKDINAYRNKKEVDYIKNVC